MLREDKDSNRVVAMASPSHVQVEIMEVQKLEISKGQSTLQREECSRFKDRKMEKRLWFPRQRGWERRSDTILVSRKPDRTACSRVLEVSPYSFLFQ